MSERLIIENFLGLKNIDMEVRDINILIGAQSVGKSVCAKLLYYFKEIVTEFANPEEDAITKKKLNKILIERFYKYFHRQFLGTSQFIIRYEIGQDYIEIKKNVEENNSIIISYSDILFNNRKMIINEAKNHFNTTDIESLIKHTPKYALDRQKKLMNLTRH
jgi:hypothetical protein